MNDIGYGYVLKTKISSLNFDDNISLITEWANRNESKYICVCNTHSLVTGYKNTHFKKVLEESNLCVPDGMPLVFALRRLGVKKQERVDGPNLMLRLCKDSLENNQKIFLYGGKSEKIDQLEIILKEKFPGIKIVGKISPPFRELSENEELEIINQINKAQPSLVFVSLGCPKQEEWMYKNRNNVSSVMIGVGAAFDFIIGDIKRPPLIFQKAGLEWIFRLASEPKRLFKRYAYNNTLFIINYMINYKYDYYYTKKENSNNK